MPALALAEIGSTQVQTYIALIIFLVTYGFIISEKVSRAIVALLGALAMVIIGIVDLETALFEYIEWGTIVLLIGMMILVTIANQSGLFEYIAIRAAKTTKGDPIKVLILLSALTALGSAFLDNVTTVLLIVPITFSITKILKIAPFPFLLAEVLFANIGGTATLIGDPPNIMIGAANPHLTFNAFLLNLAPIILIITVVTIGILYFVFRKQLHVEAEDRQKLMEIDENSYIVSRKLVTRSSIVLVSTIALFVLHPIFDRIGLHLEAPAIAILGATILMLLTIENDHQLEGIFARVEWTTIFFFAGLFVLVGGIQEAGIIRYLAEKTIDLTGGDIQTTATAVLWLSGIASATIDNIPFVATMIPLINDVAAGIGLSPADAKVDVLWWSLALGACLGGNGTLIGASANVIVAGLATRQGEKFTYMRFLIYGAPITIVTLILSQLYLWIRYY
ncbi:ArsB/NhaD family transporter [Exiguobacterium acetylicum]|uniref:ArsB/NhaD family transporter n=1 Tax=Exiguobacterium sp. BMC-KP TaxID=1684312 RepID=UPI0006AA3E1F|nr:ArsB/NhaD family transporter [Exiguobacterium sp. BMC-KP]KOP28512.1 membrane protein [Exiguobacterium sp. BMC-KP]